MTDRVRRRDVLATLASASGAALAGCSERNEEPLEYECQDEPVEAASVEVGPKDWTTPRGDAANTGVNTDIDPPQPDGENGYGRGPDLLSNGIGISDPVIADGTVFATTTNRTWAINGETGGHYWFVTETGGQPILTEDVLAYATRNEIVVRETGTGCSRWEVSPTGGYLSITARGRTVYSVTDSALQAWAVEDGAEKWSVSLSGITYPEIAATNSALFIIGQTQVLSFDYGGDRRWREALEPTLNTGFGPTIAGNRVYVVPNHRGLIALDVDDGTEQWRDRVGKGWSSRPAATPTDVYVADKVEGAVRSLAAEDGSENWSNDRVSMDIRANPSVGGETLFVPRAGRFDPGTGEQLGQLELNTYSVSAADDGIYYTSIGGETEDMDRVG